MARTPIRRIGLAVAVLLSLKLAVPYGTFWGGPYLEPAITDQLAEYGVSASDAANVSSLMIAGLFLSLVLFGLLGASINRMRWALVLELIAAAAWAAKASFIGTGPLASLSFVIGFCSPVPWILLNALTARLRRSGDHGPAEAKKVEDLSGNVGLLVVGSLRSVFVVVVASVDVGAGYHSVAVVCVLSAFATWRLGPDTTTMSRRAARDAFVDAIRSRYGWAVFVLSGINHALLQPWDLFSQAQIRLLGGGDVGVLAYGITFSVPVIVGVVFTKLSRERQFAMLDKAFALAVAALVAELCMLALDVGSWWPIIVVGFVLEIATTATTLVLIAGAGERQRDSVRDAVTMLVVAAKFGLGAAFGLAVAAFLAPTPDVASTFGRPVAASLVMALLGVPGSWWLLGILRSGRHLKADPTLMPLPAKWASVWIRVPGGPLRHIDGVPPWSHEELRAAAVQWSSRLSPLMRRICLQLADGGSRAAPPARVVRRYTAVWVHEFVRLQLEAQPLLGRKLTRDDELPLRRLEALWRICPPSRLQRGPSIEELAALVQQLIDDAGREDADRRR